MSVLGILNLDSFLPLVIAVDVKTQLMGAGKPLSKPCQLKSIYSCLVYVEGIVYCTAFIDLYPGSLLTTLLGLDYCRDWEINKKGKFLLSASVRSLRDSIKYLSRNCHVSHVGGHRPRRREGTVTYKWTPSSTNIGTPPPNSMRFGGYLLWLI